MVLTWLTHFYICAQNDHRFWQVKTFFIHLLVLTVHVVTIGNEWLKSFVFYLQFNFVGRILGPRGMTAKELEQYTGCKIMVRGKGSMRDKAKVSLHWYKRSRPHTENDLIKYLVGPIVYSCPGTHLVVSTWTSWHFCKN